MDSSTVMALIALAGAALLTIVLLVRFFSSSSSSGRSARRGKIEGFERRADGDSYVNLFALFSPAALEEAEAKKVAEEQAKQKKAAAKEARAEMMEGASKTMASGSQMLWQGLKAKLFGTGSTPQTQPWQTQGNTNNKKQRPMEVVSSVDDEVASRREIVG